MLPNDNGTKKELVLYRIETAKSDIKSAKILMEAGEFRGANNRAYYGIYHTISAIHDLDGNTYKRHKDALANFNKNSFGPHGSGGASGGSALLFRLESRTGEAGGRTGCVYLLPEKRSWDCKTFGR